MPPLWPQIDGFGVVIPKRAKNVDVAEEFVKYLIQPEALNASEGRPRPLGIPYPSAIKSDPFWLNSGDPRRLAYFTETTVDLTFPLLEAYSLAAVEMDSEHVFQVAFADVTRNRMKPEDATVKAFKRIEEIFTRYPIQQT